jgi:hypothetical protein
VVWYPVNGAICLGDTRPTTGTPQSAYCNAHLHYLALLLPGLVVIAAATFARQRGSVMVFAAGCAVALALAISPGVMSAVLSG